MSLETLRKMRAQIEESVTIELAQTTQQLTQVEQRCHALDAQIQANGVLYIREAEQGMTIENLLEWHARMNAYHTALQEARQAFRSLIEVWNEIQARLVVACQERKIVERLVERQRQVHRSEMQRREMLAMDEAAHRRHYSAGERSL